MSHHQGRIDWPRVAKAGVRFAYIKASEGESFRDARFGANWRGARRAGIVPGAYHFYSLCKPPAVQAANYLAAAPPARPALPPAVDLEFGGNCGRRPRPDALRAEVRLFLDAVEAAWRRPAVLYVTTEFYAEYIEGHVTTNPLWVRSVFCPPRWAGYGPWTLWQYANRGRLEGISTFVDLDVYDGSPADFHAFIGGVS